MGSLSYIYSIDDMRCICNVTLRRFRETTATVKKLINITYSECLSVALVIQQAKHIRHIVICGLSCCTIFFHVISQTVWLCAKKNTENETCVVIFAVNCVWNISNSKNNGARCYYICAQVLMWRTGCTGRGLMKLEFSLQSFGKYPY
jgi:hypothetical protein